jgi:hypothetical protein
MASPRALPAAQALEAPDASAAAGVPIQTHETAAL